MNKEYKQWKKFLAKPYMLIILGLFYNDYLFGVNLIFNFILSLEGIIGRIKEYAATGKQFPVAFLYHGFSYRKTKWFLGLFLLWRSDRHSSRKNAYQAL